MKYLAIALLCFLSFGLKAQKIIDHELIVELQENKTIEDLSRFLQSSRAHKNLRIQRKLSQTQEIYLLSHLNKLPISIEELNEENLFSYISHSKMTTPRATPNDAFYDQQWTLQNIQAELAWDITTGGQTIEGDEIIIAVLDDGFFLELEDWGDNIYTNPHESEGDANNDGCPGDCGVDDDGDGLIDEDSFGREPGDPGYDASFSADDDENGYKDDIHGLNATQQNDAHTSQRHGTSSAGIIGAKADNNVGVAGLNWDIKILPLSSGLRLADIIETYNYITDMRRLYNETDGEKGAFIVVCNYSLGVDFGQPEDFPIWCSMYDKMGEQGILNVSAVSNENYNVDVEGDIPSLCDSDYLIAVTSTDIDDAFAEAAFGDENVDMAAPGEATFTLHPLNTSGYGIFSGTSAAAPHVAGAIGLLYSVDCPEFIDFFKRNPSKVDSLAELVIQSGDQLESLASLVRSEKRLNVYNAMVEVSRFCGGTKGEVRLSTIYPNPVTNELNFNFEADPAEEIYLKIYNILGQLIREEKMTFPLFEEAEGTINTEHLIPGMYFLSLQQGRNIATSKFYKSN